MEVSSSPFFISMFSCSSALLFRQKRCVFKINYSSMNHSLVGQHVNFVCVHLDVACRMLLSLGCYKNYLEIATGNATMWLCKLHVHDVVHAPIKTIFNNWTLLTLFFSIHRFSVCVFFYNCKRDIYTCKSTCTLAMMFDA